MSRVYFYSKVVFAWLFVLFGVLMLLSTLTNRGKPGIFLLWLLLMIFVMTSAVAHVRRVRLINGSVDGATLANRQRRQIELPMGPEQAFDVVDAAVREVPNVEDVDSTRATLQIRANVRRVYPYATAPLLQSMLGWFGTTRNQVFAIMKPQGETTTVDLLCEPESGIWRDWFTVDNGTNLENAESISRAISRRITEARRGEQAATKETATEKELAVARLALLHAQVEPHFLYNTLGKREVPRAQRPGRGRAHHRQPDPVPAPLAAAHSTTRSPRSARSSIACARISTSCRSAWARACAPRSNVPMR